MKTTNRLFHSMTRTDTEHGVAQKIIVKVKLHDDYGNGHEDFSVTCDIYERGRDVGGGAAHDLILELWPELQEFVDLHLCDSHGSSMHCIGNAFYWFAGIFEDNLGQKYTGSTGSTGKSKEECKRIFARSLHLSYVQIEKLINLKPLSASLLSLYCERMGLRSEWEAKAKKAIERLEDWTGEKFKSEATRQNWEPLEASKVEELEEKLKSGYFTKEQVDDRHREAMEAKIEKKRRAIELDFEAKKTKAEDQRSSDLELLRVCGIKKPNVIYYDHSNTLQANWSNTEKLFTREEWEEFTRQIEASKFPAGLKFKFQDRPKY